MTKMVFCPRCKKEAVFSSANPYRPFCSERCRLIDLGDWASEKYRVPTSDSQEAMADEFEIEEMNADSREPLDPIKKN